MRIFFFLMKLKRPLTKELHRSWSHYCEFFTLRKRKKLEFFFFSAKAEFHLSLFSLSGCYFPVSQKVHANCAPVRHLFSLVTHFDHR